MSVMAVQILVAIDDSGNIDCIPYVPYHMQYKQRSDAFIAEKRADKRQWQLSYLSATVPIPTEPMIESTVSLKPR